MNSAINYGQPLNTHITGAEKFYHFISPRAGGGIRTPNLRNSWYVDRPRETHTDEQGADIQACRLVGR